MHRTLKQYRRNATAAVLAAALLSSFATPAAAQRPTQAQQNAIRQSCRADYQAHCASVPTGGSAALACLQQHAAQLSPPCQTAVAAVGGPANNAAPPAAASAAPRGGPGMLREACRTDYRQFCHGVRPGGGRALGCLKDNAESLSDACRNALTAIAR